MQWLQSLPMESHDGSNPFCFRKSNDKLSGLWPGQRHNQVALAPVFHLFPSRTEKLSPGAPMVLHRNAGE